MRWSPHTRGACHPTPLCHHTEYNRLTHRLYSSGLGLLEEILFNIFFLFNDNCLHVIPARKIMSLFGSFSVTRRPSWEPHPLDCTKSRNSSWSYQSPIRGDKIPLNTPTSTCSVFDTRGTAVVHFLGREPQ